MLWHPTKKEIEDWLDSKTLVFVQEESAGTWLSTDKGIGEYMYSDIYEILFVNKKDLCWVISQISTFRSLLWEG